MSDPNIVANNGVNVEALIAARDALAKSPKAAQFKWRAACEWKNGTHSRSTVEGFYGLGQEQRHRKTFIFDVDHPEPHGSPSTPARRCLMWAARFSVMWRTSPRAQDAAANATMRGY
jgi:hypothetical protein